MKRVEITYRSEANEVSKLHARLERAEKTLAKKLANAEKYGVAEWTGEQHSEWLETVDTENGWLVNKEDINRNGVWYDLIRAEREVEDIKDRIQKAEKRLEKAETALQEYYDEVEKIADIKTREELYREEFEKEQKVWAKDGIKLLARYTGYTPNGKRFWVERNCGWTERSWHCWTLTFANENGKAYTVFTSGEFWRAYLYIKNN